jgi:glycosyltransferase involved in cell wall biosynthesis
MGQIYFDFTDLIINLMRQRHCNGIQRVQIQLATQLLNLRPEVKIFTRHAGGWHDLTALLKKNRLQVDEIVKLLTDYFETSTARYLMRLRGHLIEQFVPLRPRRGDTLLVSGAFWERDSIIEFYENAAARGVTVICLYHDFLPLMHPQFTGHDFADAFRRLLRLPAHVVVSTPFNRAEAETSLGVLEPGAGPRTISVVPFAHEFPGALRNERGGSGSQKVVSQIGHENFVLFVSTVEVRKNHLMLFSVWDELAQEIGSEFPQLVIAGKRGWKADSALARLDEPRAPMNRITFIESPSDLDLRWLYSKCSFTIFPSFFEGWGIPVGESLWFGKACAASNTSSVPAVGGNLCVYFSPYDREQMKAAVRKLMNPAIRASCEAKIRAAPLRTWDEVSSDFSDLLQHSHNLLDQRRLPFLGHFAPPSLRNASRN